MQDSKVLVGFLGAPAGGFVVGVLAWILFKVPDDERVGDVVLHGERLGPWHGMSAALNGVGGICTLLAWVVLGVLYLRARKAA